MNISSLNSAPKKSVSQPKPSGKFLISEQAMKDFFAKQNFKFQDLWKSFKNNEVDLSALKKAIDETFENAARAFEFDEKATLLDVLKTCFGNSAPEAKRTKLLTCNSIQNLNNQRKIEAQKIKATYIKWQENPLWASCTYSETSQLFLSLISKAICSYLDTVQELENEPSLLLAIINLKAEKERFILIECITPLTLSSKSLPLAEDSKEEDDEFDEIFDNELWMHEGQMWEAIDKDLGTKTQVFLLSAGIACIAIGIIGQLSF